MLLSMQPLWVLARRAPVKAPRFTADACRGTPVTRTTAPPLAPDPLVDGLLAAARLAAADGPSGALAEAMAGVVARALGCGTAVVRLRRRAWDDLVVAGVYGAVGTEALTIELGGGADARPRTLSGGHPLPGPPLSGIDPRRLAGPARPPQPAPPAPP